MVRSGDLRVHTRGFSHHDVLDVGVAVPPGVGPDVDTYALQAADVWGERCWIVVRDRAISCITAVAPDGLRRYDLDGNLVTGGVVDLTPSRSVGQRIR